MARGSSEHRRYPNARRRTVGALGAALVATLLSLPEAAQQEPNSPTWLAQDEFVCATDSPDLRGRYTTLATRAPDGVPLHF